VDPGARALRGLGEMLLSRPLLLLAVVYAGLVAIVTIADMDQPFQGLVRVSRKALERAQETMQ
jgi:hypothetical protein